MEFTLLVFVLGWYLLKLLAEIVTDAVVAKVCRLVIYVAALVLLVVHYGLLAGHLPR